MAEGWRASVWIGWVAAAFFAGMLVERAFRDTAWPGYADVYDDVAPAVVGVSVEAADHRVGSGFAVSPDRVITARHLVVGAEEITVRRIDGHAVPAHVIGTDARTDLALLEATEPVFTPAQLGSTANLRVGDTVLAVGNPFGLGHSLAVGVVGNLQRKLGEGGPGPQIDFLQLTIPLNPGNSGGPVFDRHGRVVAVLSGTHAQGQAIAFAVPVEALEEALPALEKGEQLSRAFLGVRTEDVEGGVEVVSVIPAGPADRAGVLVGDRILSIDGEPIGSPTALHAVLDHLAAGTRARLGVRRGDKALVLEAELSDWADYPIVIAGMTLRPSPGSGGEVVAVRPRSRAERAGIRIRDVVRTVDGLPVQAPAAVQEALVGGSARQLEVLRDGGSVLVQLPGPG